jgi:hypothetical protein
MCRWRSRPPGGLWSPGRGKHANHEIARLQSGSSDSPASSRLREAALKSRRSSSLQESDQSILECGESAANRSARADNSAAVSGGSRPNTSSSDASRGSNCRTGLGISHPYRFSRWCDHQDIPLILPLHTVPGQTILRLRNLHCLPRPRRRTRPDHIVLPSKRNWQPGATNPRITWYQVFIPIIARP